MEKDWGLWFFTGVYNSIASTGFLNGSNTTQPPSFILLAFNHCFQKQILKAEESFRSEGRILWKVRDHFSACQSTLPPSTRSEESLTTSWPANAKRHACQTASLRAGLPCFTQPYSSCARPPGGCSAGPEVSSSIRHTFTLCQCCLVSYHTMLGCLRNAASSNTLLHQSHFSIQAAAFPLPSFLQVPSAGISMTSPVSSSCTEGSHETDSSHFLCIEQDVGQFKNYKLLHKSLHKNLILI